METQSEASSSAGDQDLPQLFMGSGEETLQVFSSGWSFQFLDTARTSSHLIRFLLALFNLLRVSATPIRAKETL